MARAIVKPSTVGIPVRLLNPLPNPVELIKNSTIAELNSTEVLGNQYRRTIGLINVTISVKHFENEAF